MISFYVLHVYVCVCLGATVSILNFTLDHDNSFLVQLEEEAVDSRQQLDLIVQMIVYWSVVCRCCLCVCARHRWNSLLRNA